LIFTGAMASVRGKEDMAAFAAAKHGVRAVAQSLAVEFEIHVRFFLPLLRLSMLT
jgi:NAD(P)-dependent dehydrogenase (short-subunit alcohol dehydrogenase family)